MCALVLRLAAAAATAMRFGAAAFTAPVYAAGSPPCPSGPVVKSELVGIGTG
jgi:hypothetical protein